MRSIRGLHLCGNMKSLSVCFVFTAMLLTFTVAFDLTTYFGTSSDGSRITWAHGVNSRKDLIDALNGDVMMLETDISMGSVTGNTGRTDQTFTEPIMAHPPLNQSDINLNDWLDLVINYKGGYKKGIKLDFKFDEVLEPSFQILQSKQDKINFPLIINADILPGPVNPTAKPVTAFLFLSLCKKYFPSSIISPGWTTSMTGNDSTSHLETYSWSHVYDMMKELKKANITQSVTFPVRATFIPKSFETLTWLIDVVPRSSLTVWMGLYDTVNVKDLIEFRQRLPLNILYFDLPIEGDLEAIRKSSTYGNSIESSLCGKVLRKPFFHGDRCVAAGSTAMIMESTSCIASFRFPLSAVIKQSGFVLKGVVEFLNKKPSHSPVSVVILSFGQNLSQIYISSEGLIKAHTNQTEWHTIQETGTTFGFEISIPKVSSYTVNSTEVIVRLLPHRPFEQLNSQDMASHHKYKMQRMDGSQINFQILTVGRDPKIIRQLETFCLASTASVLQIHIWILAFFVTFTIGIFNY
ncbi:hypothetical protein CHUAL_013746 [Chamberlinius hualienensis]